MTQVKKPKCWLECIAMCPWASLPLSDLNKDWEATDIHPFPKHSKKGWLRAALYLESFRFLIKSLIFHPSDIFNQLWVLNRDAINKHYRPLTVDAIEAFNIDAIDLTQRSVPAPRESLRAYLFYSRWNGVCTHLQGRDGPLWVGDFKIAAILQRVIRRYWHFSDSPI